MDALFSQTVVSISASIDQLIQYPHFDADERAEVSALVHEIVFDGIAKLKVDLGL